jgi:hypothetical protein
LSSAAQPDPETLLTARGEGAADGGSRTLLCKAGAAVGASAARTCPICGGTLRRIGDDITETLDYVSGHIRVIRHVRAELPDCTCDTVVAAAKPEHC